MKTTRIVNGWTPSRQQFSGEGREVVKSIRTECSVEIDDVFVIKRLGRSVEGWCARCESVSTQVTPEDAAMLLGTGPRAVYRLVEANEVHWSEGPEKLVLVCLASLLKTDQDSETR
jgi:hypothetical protein